MTKIELATKSAPSVAWLLGTSHLPAHIDPDQIALRWTSGTRTYKELRRRALSIAANLRRMGLKEGDRVASHFLNRGETFELYFACAFAGLTFIPIGFRLTAREVAFILNDSQPRVLLTQDCLSDVAREAIPRADQPPTLLTLRDDSGGEEYDELCSFSEEIEGPVGYTNTQMLLYTSGTTGRPKGVKMSHMSIMWFAFQQIAYYPNLTSTSSTLLTGPMFNTAAMNEQSIPAFLSGGTVAIFPSRGWTADRMATVIDDWQVSHAVIYPSMMEPLLELDSQKPAELTSLQFVLTGGENCPPATVARFRQRWSHLSFGLAYGSTESGVVSILFDEEIDQHPGSVGRAFGGQTFEIRDSALEPVPPGKVGEVWTAGPSVTEGYWDAPELDKEALVDGWLKMGDLGRVDTDGFLFIEGRSKDMIISKGQNIYPAEIENVLLEHHDIVDAAVVGVPDEASGEAVCACVVTATGSSPTSDEIISFVRERIASYKKPRHVVFFDRLPRNEASKVDKKKLSIGIEQRINTDTGPSR